ncbi:MAG: hypothetical protein WD059_09410 [Balneolaceae bacterium]
MDFEAIAPSFGSAGTGIKGILKNEPGDGAGQRLPIVETKPRSFSADISTLT